jgi:hypothetical protein
MKQTYTFLLLFVVLTGCKTHTVYVPVEHTTTEYKDRLRLDSIYYRDTIRLFSVGDTVYKDVVRWRERFVRDTVYHKRTDSIPVIVEKEIQVNYLTRWQHIRLQILNVIAALLLVYLAYLFGKKKLF